MGIMVLAICFRLGTGLRAQLQGLVYHKGATRLRFIQLALVFFFRSFFFQFCGSPQERACPRRERRLDTFFSSATSELKARSLHRDLTAG